VLAPVGEYALSCVGRERIYEHFSRELNIPMAILRLNYATEMRYGVLVDLAQRIRDGAPIDLSIGPPQCHLASRCQRRRAVRLWPRFHAAAGGEPRRA